ncbi:MAG TPA: DUF4260 domain-containing protein [Ferruginibacter sp.]|nr:DUF4260 domain-containing protein [Ferruginibacter sp.]
MKLTLKLEELAMLIVTICYLYAMGYAWWSYLLLALAPDISMLGYVAGNKAGAFCYNLFHHKGIAIACFMIGLLYDIDVLVLIGIILFGHSSMDRFFGYGLKYEEGFKFTHLGSIGKK